MKKDALGQPIVLGKRYGYANNSNGITRVVLGTATKETNTDKVTLRDLEVNHFLYGDPTDAPDSRQDSVSVMACLLFPVPEKK